MDRMDRKGRRGGLSELNKAGGESRKGAVKGAEAGRDQWDWTKRRE